MYMYAKEHVYGTDGICIYCGRCNDSDCEECAPFMDCEMQE